MSDKITGVTFLASAARTATETSDGVKSDGFKGCWLALDITAASTSVTLDVKLQQFEDLSGKWVDVPGAAFAQQTGTGTNGLTVYPGIAETANVSVSDRIAPNVRAIGTLGGASTPTATYSLGGHWLD